MKWARVRQALPGSSMRLKRHVTFVKHVPFNHRADTQFANQLHPPTGDHEREAQGDDEDVKA